jgi:hypothetical protein
MLTLLTDKESLNILYKSIDNDTALAEDISKEIPTQGMTKDLAYNLGSLHE